MFHECITSEMMDKISVQCGTDILKIPREIDITLFGRPELQMWQIARPMEILMYQEKYLLTEYRIGPTHFDGK